ncbi:MAG TPA: hypothetical protein VFT09_10245 [Ilumatobacteraceae bacterium]|nr:hypothetical protein [Ilumatobacteraceae bacterium]
MRAAGLVTFVAGRLLGARDGWLSLAASGIAGLTAGRPRGRCGAATRSTASTGAPLACRLNSLFLHRDFTVGVFHARPYPVVVGCFGLATGSCWRSGSRRRSSATATPDRAAGGPEVRNAGRATRIVDDLR